MSGAKGKKKPNDAWSSKEMKSLLHHLGIPNSADAMAQVIRMDMGARAASESEVMGAATRLAEIFLASVPVTTNDPSALPGVLSLTAMDKSADAKKLTKNILRRFVRMDKIYRKDTVHTTTINEPPAPDTTPRAAAPGNAISMYITDQSGFAEFSDAFVQLADMAERDGEGVALRKAIGLVKIFSEKKGVLDPNTPPRVLLEFCRAHRAKRRAVDVGAEPEDDHTPDPIDLRGQDPRLPPKFLHGNEKFKKYLYAMDKEFHGHNKRKPQKMLELALAMKAFAQKEMQREGLGDGNQIDPSAIIKHYFGNIRPETAPTGSESMDSNEPVFLVMIDKMKQVDWPGFCVLYKFAKDQDTDLLALGIRIIKKGGGDPGVLSLANKLLQACMQTKPKVRSKIKNGRHLVGAILDAAIKKGRGKPLGSKAMTAGEAAALLKEFGVV